jgi:hypothetical protein
MKIQNSKLRQNLFIRDISTVGCTVRFRMSPDDEQVVRRFYNMDPNRGMFSRSCSLTPDIQYEGIESPEVIATGGGWYTIYGDGVHVNSALHTFYKVEVALSLRERPKHDEGIAAREAEIKKVYQTRHRVPVVVKQQRVRGRMVSVAVTRALQVTEANRINGVGETFLKLANALKQPEPLTLEKGIELLKSKFHRS